MGRLQLIGTALALSACSPRPLIYDGKDLYPGGIYEDLSALEFKDLPGADGYSLMTAASPAGKPRVRLKEGETCSNDYTQWEPKQLNIYLGKTRAETRHAFEEGTEQSARDLQILFDAGGASIEVHFWRSDKYAETACEENTSSPSFNLRTTERTDLVICEATEQWWATNIGKPKVDGATSTNLSSTSNISRAFIAFNERYLDENQDDQAAIRRLLNHELMHVAGFGHAEYLEVFQGETGFSFPMEHEEELLFSRSSYDYIRGGYEDGELAFKEPDIRLIQLVYQDPESRPFMCLDKIGASR